MRSHENVPTTPPKRAPPVSLNVKTGSETDTTRYNNLSPRTPPSQIRHVGRSKGASKALDPRPALRETFLDDITPVDKARDEEARDDPDEKDLHDLSLSPRHVTRNSVVDNMLLSLDQFSSRGEGALDSDEGRFHSTLDDDDPYTVNRRYASTKSGSRIRGHKYSSSYSSDYDPYADDASSRYSSHYSRGRRSNSSSNFPTALPRIDSVRTDKEGFIPKGKTSEVQRAAAPGEPAFRTHSRGGRKGSKSSGSSSLDFGQMIGSSAWQRAIDRRPTTFDRGHTKGASIVPQSKYSPTANISNGRSRLLDAGFEAAPTPTVPVGPRRTRSPPPAVVFPPQLAHPDPLSPVSASTSIKPRKDSYRKGRSEMPANKSLRRRADETSSDKGTASILTGPSPAAPSPTVNYRKPSVTTTHGSTPQAKDRPGFFRRVFGSSKSMTSMQNDIHPPQLPPMTLPSFEGRELFESQGSHEQPHNFHAKLSKPPPTRDPPAVPPKDTTPQPLNKKPSLFFRRRKKSVSGIEPPAVVPLQMHAKARDANANTPGDRSPVSSLRKVMNPYLHSPVSSPQDFHDSIEQQDLSPDELVKDYDPPTDARKAPTSTDSHMFWTQDGDDKVLVSSSHDVASVVLDNPKISGEAKPDAVRRDDQANSFLQDSSDNDGRSSKTSPYGRSPVLRYRMENPRANTTDNVPNFACNAQAEHQNSQTREPVTVNTVEALPATARKAPNPDSPQTTKCLRRNLSPQAVANALDDDEWVVTPSRPKDDGASPGNSSRRSSRVWILPTTSEEQLKGSSKLSPSLGATQDPARASGSTISDYTSAKSLSVVHTVGKDGISDVPEQGANKDIPTEQIDPSVECRAQARKVYEGDEEFVSKAGAAAWLGESSPERVLVRKAYMECFDWTNFNILSALRGFCGKLILKGETQQVDRILDAFSTRWCECNPNHGFKATDVVHTICYSIILLNTDLHLAEIEQKMTRGQFIRNTMPTIRRVAADAAPDGFDTVRASRVPLRPQVPWSEPASPTAPTPSSPLEAPESISTPDAKRPTNTLSTRPSDRSEHDTPRSQSLTPLDHGTPYDDCGPLVKAPFPGKISMWEIQVEIVLKNFFNSIRLQPLPLHGRPNEPIPDQPMPTNTLSVFTGTLLRRTPSTLSKAASETLGSRGRALEGRLGTGRWTSKTRSRPRLFPASSVASTRASFDDDSSIWSPSISSTWSKHSFTKTQTSMSVNSLASDYPQADYQQSIGFANALSQAIIREEAAGTALADEPVRVAPLLEDETLELAGAPWAKEGILKHKHHLEVVDKRAKDRNWNECFAVIEKGWMRLFSFNTNAKSMRLKAKNQRAPGGVVGGGNWSENAEALGTFMLRQTIASALPPPGYSKARPHVWALSLPSGAVHLFQVGTPEIVKEFVTTANYWSARLSKEPLVGGVSNIEHGWSDVVINTALVHTDGMPPATMGHSRRPSLHGSLRGSLDQGSVRPKLPGDKVIISDWNPPPQSMVASALMEVDQLRALTTYVNNIEDELQKHNELRSPMLLAFSSRHPNSGRAMSNWERKSSYLLREIVKFRTYIDCLNTAQAQKEKLYASRSGPPEPESMAKSEEAQNGPATRASTSEIVPLRKQLKDEAKKKRAARGFEPRRKKGANDEPRLEKWELTVGIEIHAQLNTARKLFSSAAASVNDPSNSHVALFDVAFPGTQPRFQTAALIPALRAATALHCSIQRRSRFDRKHYFYQDQPAGYQLTQYYEPFAKDGTITLYAHDGIAPEDGDSITIGIKQIQMEQDTAKSLLQPHETHLLDFNRVGHPLIEIITLPQIHHAQTAAACVRKVQGILQAVNAVTVGMEMGGLRADVNVSVRRKGRAGQDDNTHEYYGVKDLGQRTEIKNLSSYKAVQDAIIAERNRQIDVLEGGGVIEGETRGWAVGSTETTRLRGKEGEVDYRYMPDPDLGPVVIGKDVLDHIIRTMPVVPDQTLEMLTTAPYYLTPKDAKTIMSLDDGSRVDYYCDAIDNVRRRMMPTDGSDIPRASAIAIGKTTGNWVLHELGGLFTTSGEAWNESIVPADQLALLPAHLLQKKITGRTAKQLLTMKFEGDERDVDDIVDEEGLWLVPMQKEEYIALAQRLLDDNDDIVQHIKKKGRMGPLQWFVGRMMREGEEGRVEAEKAEAALKEILGLANENSR